jgi:hypothetical protein
LAELLSREKGAEACSLEICSSFVEAKAPNSSPLLLWGHVYCLAVKSFHLAIDFGWEKLSTACTWRTFPRAGGERNFACWRNFCGRKIVWEMLWLGVAFCGF